MPFCTILLNNSEQRLETGRIVPHNSAGAEHTKRTFLLPDICRPRGLHYFRNNSLQPASTNGKTCRLHCTYVDKVPPKVNFHESASSRQRLSSQPCSSLNDSGHSKPAQQALIYRPPFAREIRRQSGCFCCC